MRQKVDSDDSALQVKETIAEVHKHWYDANNELIGDRHGSRFGDLFDNLLASQLRLLNLGQELPLYASAQAHCMCAHGGTG